MKSAPLKVTTPSEREVVVTRVVAAPRGMVFDAHTTPELVQRWLLGPPGWAMPVCEIDLRVGGKYRFVWQGPGGEKLAMGGEYREIVKPERIVSTEHFDDPWYEGQVLDTLTFVEKDGKTIATTTVLCDSKEIRDGMLKSGMTRGIVESYDVLDDVLSSIAGEPIAAKS